jgi:hypothetical protein
MVASAGCLARTGARGACVRPRRRARRRAVRPGGKLRPRGRAARQVGAGTRARPGAPPRARGPHLRPRTRVPRGQAGAVGPRRRCPCALAGGAAGRAGPSHGGAEHPRRDPSWRRCAAACSEAGRWRRRKVDGSAGARGGREIGPSGDASSAWPGGGSSRARGRARGLSSQAPGHAVVTGGVTRARHAPRPPYARNGRATLGAPGRDSDWTSIRRGCPAEHPAVTEFGWRFAGGSMARPPRAGSG